MIEILKIFVSIIGFATVSGDGTTVNMLEFTGDSSSEWFQGKILPGGVDTQRFSNDGGGLSARYMLRGVDCKGDSCTIFIENNAVFGQPTTSPSIITDSKALGFLNNNNTLSGTIEGREGGVTITIFSETTEATNNSDKASKTFVYQGNPIVKDKFTADPAPMVHDGRLYLYVGHDEYYDGQDTASGGHEFNITEWLCYSTDDMVNWTDHGSVLKPTDFDWAVGEAWASQVVEKDGKFYYFVTAQGGGDYAGKCVGVAVSDSPTGPFVDAIGRPLIDDKMTDNGVRGWWNDIDPTVLLDGDEAWLCWGNGTCFLAPLNPDLISLAGEIQVLDLPNYVEGPWLHRRGDIYYLTYASMGGSSEAIDYATAPSMAGPWTHQGQLTGNAENSFTIHPGIINFNGKDYLFYHNATLEIDGIKGAIGRRAVCFDTLYYNEDGTMQKVNQTTNGLIE